ncbi:hypothetical protein ACSQ67_021998 [Phaseolus vulgaris]
MEGDIVTLMKVWPPVVISLCYCYWIRKVVPPGTIRLLLLLPIIFLYIVLPLSFSSVHLSGTIGFFLGWLANFKLLLFAFDKGPLSSDQFISLPRFVAVACLPIKIQQNAPGSTHTQHSSTKNGKTPHPDPSKSSGFDTHPSSKKPNSASQHKQNLSSVNGGTPLVGGCSNGEKHVGDRAGAAVQGSTVLNLTARLLGEEMGILRPTVYEPTLKGASKVVGSRWAPLPAVMGTFVVSGLMHELILFYLGRLEPTFRMTCFFLLHGICLVAEIALKTTLTGRWRLPRFVSGPLTVVFVMGTSLSLFLPEFIRCRVDVRAFEEYAALGHLLTALKSFL